MPSPDLGSGRPRAHPGSRNSLPHADARVGGEVCAARARDDDRRDDQIHRHASRWKPGAGLTMTPDTKPKRTTPTGTVAPATQGAHVVGHELAEAPVEILIVDDRPENLLALEAILEPLGQTLVRANSGDDALRKLLTHDVAAILLDVQMPGMNGFEAARLIKARERSKYIPIIFLTAISKDEAYVFEGYSVGAVDYLFKPFQPEIL